MSKTTLIITTRDRPDYLKRAVGSALNQTRPFDKIIISDNSSSLAVKHKNKSLLTPYLNQNKNLMRLIPTPVDFPSDNHTKYIQDNYIENGGFCVLFHDDDELLPNYHETAIAAIKSNSEIIAVGCNALKLRDSVSVSGTIMGHKKGLKIIQTKRELLTYYMEIGPTSPPPLCGYFFRATVLKSIPFTSTVGGKYSDVVALSEATVFGKIIWVYEPLLRYRTHISQNSRRVSTLDFRSLFNYMLNEGGFVLGSIQVESYRFKHMRLKLIELVKSNRWQSSRTVVCFLTSFTLRKLIWRWQTFGYLWKLLRRK
jgi:glycosyltransferase involved in cell wall biosynthesis